MDITKAKKLISAATDAWEKDNLPKIEQVVNDRLDRHLDEVILSALGFEFSGWADEGWKVDHCNGRSGESEAGDWLRAKAGQAAQDWLTKQAGNLPTLHKTAVASLRADYKNILEREVGRLLADHARTEAAKQVFDIIASITKE